MARPRGSRHPNHEQRRAELLARARERLARADAPFPSLRELADACGVRETTLRHYFGRRDDLVEAVLADHLAAGEPHMAHVERPSGPFARSVADVVRYMALGHREPAVRALHAAGLAEGLRSSRLGPAFLRLALEPGLRAVARRLEAHMEAGEMRRTDPRAAALLLVAPVLMGFLHQADLGGGAEAPLDLDRLLSEHVEGFVRAHRAA